MALPSPRRRAPPYARSSSFLVAVALNNGWGPTSESESESTPRETERDFPLLNAVAPPAFRADPGFEALMATAEAAERGSGGGAEVSFTTQSPSSSSFGSRLRLGLGLSGRKDLLLLRRSVSPRSSRFDLLVLLLFLFFCFLLWGRPVTESESSK